MNHVDSARCTQLLRRIDQPDTHLAGEILPLVYDELRHLAAAKMACESAAHTLQPTALVHEAWLRLGGDSGGGWQSRAQFFAAAAEAMRRILIENARKRGAARRGAGVEKVSLDCTAFEVAAPEMSSSELLLLHEALDNLNAHDPRKAELVKLWFFVGLTAEEAALVLGVSVRTAERDWVYARAWLVNEMDRLRQP